MEVSMKTIIVVYAIGVFCQEESDSSLLANVGAAELRPEAFCSSSVFARRRRRTRCNSDTPTFLTTANLNPNPLTYTTPLKKENPVFLFACGREERPESPVRVER
jgi:hypothetical protein